MRLHSLRNRSTRIVIPSRSANGRKGAGLAWSALLVGLFLAADQVTAATFEGLYTVSVAPDPEARNVRVDATRRGMRTLLARVTGLRQAADDPRLADLIAAAETHATAYGPVSDDEIRISFRRGPVNDALTRLGLPIWGDERPSTLLWIAVDFGAGERAEIGASAEPGARPGGPGAGSASNPLARDVEAVFESAMERVLTVADERGLPLELPRLDGEDRELVRFADAWGGFDEALVPVAERHGADAILIGRVQPTESGFLVRWILRRGELRQEFETLDPGEGIERLADMYAAEYTIVGEARETAITIRGIESWSDWRVLEYLQSLSIVERVRVKALSRDGDLKLEVLARGNASQLSQVLTLGGVLALPPRDDPDAAAPALPGYGTGELVLLPAWRVGEGVGAGP